MDHVDRAVEFACRFIEGLGMDSHDIGLAFKKPRKLIQRVGNHQMHVERKVGDVLELFDEGNAQREIRDEMAVHDVHVNEARSPLLDHADIALHVHEVGRQNGRGYFRAGKHGTAFRLYAYDAIEYVRF